MRPPTHRTPPHPTHIVPYHTTPPLPSYPSDGSPPGVLGHAEEGDGRDAALGRGAAGPRPADSNGAGPQELPRRARRMGPPGCPRPLHGAEVRVYVAQRYEHGYEYNAVLFRTGMVREVEKCTVEPSTYCCFLPHVCTRGWQRRVSWL